jgi:hypothetical protein
MSIPSSKGRSGSAETRLRSIEGLARPASFADEQALPVLPALESLLPGGGLQRGFTVLVEGDTGANSPGPGAGRGSYSSRLVGVVGGHSGPGHSIGGRAGSGARAPGAHLNPTRKALADRGSRTHRCLRCGAGGVARGSGGHGPAPGAAGQGSAGGAHIGGIGGQGSPLGRGCRSAPDGWRSQMAGPGVRHGRLSSRLVMIETGGRRSARIPKAGSPPPMPGYWKDWLQQSRRPRVACRFGWIAAALSWCVCWWPPVPGGRCWPSASAPACPPQWSNPTG